VRSLWAAAGEGLLRISGRWPADLPVQAYLIIIALILLLPSLGFTTYVLSSFDTADRQLFEQRLRQQAEAVADGVDREIDRITVMLRTLAVSHDLTNARFAEFHRQAIDALAGSDLGLIVIDPTLQQLVNTHVPYGTPLPQTGDPDTARRVLETKQPQISDLFIGRITSAPTLNIAVPVIRGGTVRYILLMTFTPNRVLQILRGQNLPSGWVAGVSDRKGMVIARSVMHERFVNTRLPDDLLKRRATPEVFKATNLAGEPVLRAVVPMTKVGWVVASTVPLSVVAASARDSWRLLAIGALALFVLSGLVAFFFARILSVAIGQTTEAAVALGLGKPVVTKPAPIREANAVSEALRAAAAQLKERAIADAKLAAIVRTAQEAIVGFATDGTITSWNAGAERMFGYREEEVIGRPKTLLFPTERRDELRHLIERLSSGEAIIAAETERRRKDDSIFPVMHTVGPVRADDGELIGFSASMTDITARKNWERQQQVFSRELAHRVKNAFAVLQAIARRTLSATSDPAAFARGFMGRLNSMAAAHEILTNANWQAAELGDLVRTQLASYGAGDDPRITISGPAVALPPELAVPLGLALHELATNASKYGCLSVPEGSLEILWTLREVPDGRYLSFTWRERAGPIIAEEPKHRGFGSTLIQENIPEAEVNWRFQPEGLTCIIRLRLPK
jgi:PAS domain S-box-containing protein